MPGRARTRYSPSSAAAKRLHQPIVWRHPFIFYIGHLPAFSWNQICGGILQWSSVNAYYDDLFCRGIDPDVDTGECHWHPEVPEDWPSLGDTLEYRDKVRRALLDSTVALGYSRSNDLLAQGGRVFELILEHEYMHQETLLYMMQQMAPADKVRPHDLPRYSFGRAGRVESIRIPAGKARLGARFDDLSFGWDNEFSETTVDVESFAMETCRSPTANSSSSCMPAATTSRATGGRKTGAGGSLSVSNFLPAGSNKEVPGGTGRCSTCYLSHKWQAGRCL